MSHNKSRQYLWVVGAVALLIVILHTMSVGDWISKGIPTRKQKPRYIFVDLGANAADSLETFLMTEKAKFQYDFPAPDWAAHEDAEIFLFEGNPHFNTPLIQAKQHYSELGINVNIFPSTVVDVTDGTRTFFLDTANTGHDFWGSSAYANHPDSIKSGGNGTVLSSINISRWLLMNTLPRDFVVVKMDIEGSEFEIIPHMADMSIWNVVDYLYVEWHKPSLLGGTPEEVDFRKARANAAVKKLTKEGVVIGKYNSPT